MSDGRQDFESRRQRLMHLHQARARRRIATPGPDRAIAAEPRRARSRAPLRGFVLLMAFFMMFKGFMLASLGAATYEHRLNALGDSTIFGKPGAFVMGIDPVSQVIADLLLGLA